MNKRQLYGKLEKAWAELQESFAGLSESDISRPGVAGDWSVKDILAHITTWENEGLKYLPVILAGKRPPRYSVQYGGLDAFNAQMFEKKRGLPLADVLQALEKTHRQLLDFLEHVPDEQIIRETRFRRRLRFDTYRHYAEHTEMIRAWRTNRATSRPA